MSTDPRHELEEAAEALDRAELHHLEPYQWVSSGRIEEIKRAVTALDAAIKHLKAIVPEGEEGTVGAGFLGSLVLLEVLLSNIVKPELRQYVRSWQQELEPEYLSQRLVRARDTLAELATHAERLHAPAPPTYTRGQFLRFAAAAAIAAATPGALREAVAKEPTEPNVYAEEQLRLKWERNKYYLQFGAYNDPVVAKRTIENLSPLEHIEIFPALPSQSGRQIGKYKVLLKLPYKHPEEAYETLLRLATFYRSAGVIRMEGDFTTTWCKTREEEIVEVVQRRAAAPRRHAPRPAKPAQPPAQPASPHQYGEEEYDNLIEETIARYPLKGDANWDRELVWAIIQAESRKDLNALSGKGARGLMQLMEPTFREFHLKGHLHRMLPNHRCDDIVNPALNIEAGVMFLHELFRKYYKHDDANIILILRMYNGGETKVLKGDLKNNPENRNYPGKVLSGAGNMLSGVLKAVRFK